MSELNRDEATALMAAGMYASPPTEDQMKSGIERAESFLAAHDREVKAEAWGEGFGAGVSEGISFQAGNSSAHTWPTAYINPYRIESQETP